MIVTLSVSLALGTEPKQLESSQIYTLTDNRLISFKGDFCQDLRATSIIGPKNRESSATLAFLHSRPPLTGREMFNFSGSGDLDSDTNFHRWNFYLNRGSNASVEVCYKESDVTDFDVYFYLFMGTKRFEEWVRNTNNRRTVRSMRLSEQCTSIDYQVVEDEMYYFVFFLDSQRTTNVYVEFQFNRTLYRISSDMVVENCSFPLDGTSQCTLNSPMSPGYIGFLSMESTPPIDYEDGAGIYIHCTPRAWLYAVIVVVVVLVTTCLVCSFTAVGLKFILAAIKKKKSTSTTTALGTTTVTATLGEPTAESDFIKNAPPSYSTAMDYGTPTASAPPPYPTQSYEKNMF